MKKCPVDDKSIRNLTRRAAVDLRTARRNLDADPECTFTYAYTAVMRMGLALMFNQGFRPGSAQKHQVTILFVEAILGSEHRAIIAEYDLLRRKRNKLIYEPDLPCSRGEAEEALKTAAELVAILKGAIDESRGQPRLRPRIGRI